jgi:sulfate/thiosulfate transport system substrate-binding protein
MRATRRFTVLSLCAWVASCSGEAAPAPRTDPVGRTLALACFSAPREVFGSEILPAFSRRWQERTGERVRFQESYEASGEQTRVILAGFQADVASLALEGDIARLVEAKLVDPEWKAPDRGGVFMRSIVVFAVRKGNPKGIHGWDDLARTDVEVMMPNARTSGVGKWNLAALYGAALRGHTSREKNDPKAAELLMAEVLRRVRVKSQGARESMQSFGRGAGDVAVTYENEVTAGQMRGQDFEIVVPSSTILVEYPVAVVDASVRVHGNEDVARAFVSFLLGDEVQRSLAAYGLRPVDPDLMREQASSFSPTQDLFTIRDLGDWPQVERCLFGEDGVLSRASARVGR